MKRYRIDMVLNTSQADAAARRMSQAIKASTTDADRAAKAFQAAADRKAKADQAATDRLIANAKKIADRSVAGAQKLADRQAAVATKAAERQAAASQKLADRQVAIAAKAVERQAAAAQKSADRQTAVAAKAAERQVSAAQKMSDRLKAIEDNYLAREYSQRVAFEKRKDEVAARSAAKADAMRRKLLGDEDIALKVRNAQVDVVNRKRVDAAMRAAGVEKRMFGETVPAADALKASVGGVAASFLAMATAGAAIQGIAAAFESANTQAMKAGEFVNGYREALLELASLKGQAGQTGKTLAEDVNHRRQTLQTAADSRTFQVEAMGSGASNVVGPDGKGFITDTEMKKAIVGGGRVQAITAGDAGAVGKLTGALPSMLGKPRVTGQETTDALMKMKGIVEAGNIDFGTGAKQVMEQAPYLPVFKDVMEQTSMLSLFSKTFGDEASTAMGAFTRGTAGAIGRSGVPRAEDSESSGEYMKKIGATNQMTPVEIGKKISADFAVQEGKAKAAGVKFNPLEYLGKEGYGNQDTKKAIMDFVNRDRSGEADRFLAMGAAPVVAGQGDREIDTAMRVDPVFKGRRAELTKEMGEVSQGMGVPEYFKQLQNSAYGELSVEASAKGERIPEMGTFTAQGMGPGVLADDFLNGNRKKLSDRMMMIQRREATRLKKLGRPVEMTDVATNPISLWSENRQAKAFYEQSKAIRGAGGDELSSSSKRVHELLERQTTLMEAEEARQRRTPPPLDRPPPRAGAIR